MARIFGRRLPIIAAAMSCAILIGALLLSVAPADRWAVLHSWANPLSLMSGAAFAAIVLVALLLGYATESREAGAVTPDAAWHLALFPGFVGSGALVGATLEGETASDEC